MRIVAASSRALLTSPTTSGAPPGVGTSSHVPLAARTRSAAHSAACWSACSSRLPAEIDGRFSQSMASSSSSATGDHRERVAALDRVAFGDRQLGDLARLVRGDLVLHLHRLDDRDQRALLDLVALADEHLEDVPLQRRGERVAAAGAARGLALALLRRGLGDGRGAVELAVDLDVEALAGDLDRVVAGDG